MERRKFRRYIADNSDIGITMALAKYVEVLNISIGGISLKADRRLNVGRAYSFKITTHGKVSTLKGIIAWSSLSESREDTKGNFVPIYKAGLQFTDVSQNAVNEIVEFLELKGQDANLPNNSKYINFGLEDLDIQAKEQEKLETVIDSLNYR